MRSFNETIRNTIAKHRMLKAEDRVLVGVSGGADSVALLLVLRDLGYALAVGHLNHGLRGAESNADEDFVEGLASELGLSYFSQKVFVREVGGNVEAAGRAARKAFFQSVLEAQGFTKIALAHNREDRVETFLLHLMRGSGSDGLVSMAPVAGEIVRPLIETPRSEIEAYLTEQDRSWRTDRSNLDISFARNRMRLETLPGLASLFNVRLADTLSRTVAVLSDENDWMRRMTESWLSQHGDGMGLPVQELRSVPIALVRRVIRESLRIAGSELQDLTFDHVEAVRGLLEDGKSGKQISLPGNMTAVREFDRLVFRRATPTQAEFEKRLDIPGSIHIPEIGRTFRAECLEVSESGPMLSVDSSKVFVDGNLVGAYVTIRNWKPGDYYKPVGWPSGKVKKLFQRVKVPRSLRQTWPVVAVDSAMDSAVVWVVSFPVSRDFTPRGDAKKIVAFETLRD